MSPNKDYQSWGRYPKAVHRSVIPVYWNQEIPAYERCGLPALPVGCLRSYGDSCLNDGGTLLDMTPLSRFMAFDRERGLLQAEAGVTLAEILDLIVPHGWFLPVTPGTKFVSLGGAIANDVHGKNHHRCGTFGCFVRRFELHRSSGKPGSGEPGPGKRLICSPTENQELFRATLGGLGLTGIIVWAEIQLKRIASPFLEVEQRRFSSLGEFFQLASESDRSHEYTVAWVDCVTAGKKGRHRGIFFRGNHLDTPAICPRRRTFRIPCDMPSFLLNRLTLKGFNQVFFTAHPPKRDVVHYDPFFYPLDAVLDWNRIYGRPGFLQYQCVIPLGDHEAVLREILDRVIKSDEGSFLSVLKLFGGIVSPGMLSFPRPGVTFALDFAFRGPKTLRLLDELDGLVEEAGGRVYPAKDARMSARSFRRFFPQWERFRDLMDPNLSSSFWRRVTG